MKSPGAPLMVCWPPVHETEMSWLTKFWVWFTVTARPPKVPALGSWTVSWDDVVGNPVTVPATPAQSPGTHELPDAAVACSALGMKAKTTSTTARPKAARPRPMRRLPFCGRRVEVDLMATCVSSPGATTRPG